MFLITLSQSNGIAINPRTIVEVWKDFGNAHMNETLASVTAAGYRAILAAPWYLNYIKYGKRTHDFSRQKMR